MTAHRYIQTAIAGAVAMTLLANAFAAEPSMPATPAAVRDGSHDFDFWAGRWTLANHRLKHRLSHSDEWEDCPGYATARPLLGGRANMDETLFLCGPKEGLAGAAFRTYDAKRDLWSIYWIPSGGGAPDSPMVGRFVDGVGTFLGDDTWEGKPIKVRFIWSKIDLNHAHWQQAFSPDGGKTWETNWTQELTRTGF